MKNNLKLAGTAVATQNDSDGWRELILGKAAVGDARSTWQAIFARLKDVALAIDDAAALHRRLVLPDRLLAESAWDLWEQFRPAAPSGIEELKQFWAETYGASHRRWLAGGVGAAGAEHPLFVAELSAAFVNCLSGN